MNKNVYNIIWADDEIDDLLDDETREELKKDEDNTIGCGFSVIGIAHDGSELAKELADKHDITDAVIVDANFNKFGTDVKSERIVSGLNYSWSLVDRYNNIPFFLFSARNEEVLKEALQYSPEILADFPRHLKWFHKPDEWEDLLKQIKKVVEEMESPEFIIRNKYRYELNSSTLIDGAEKFLMHALMCEYHHDYTSLNEPFMPIRRGIEKIFGTCKDWNIIPPISDDINGTARYFLHGTYRAKDNNGNYIYDEKHRYINKYKSTKRIMPESMAKSLSYIVDIVQDFAHSKDGLKLKVEEYWNQTHDSLLLMSCVYIYMDILKWFASTMLTHRDKENNATLWQENK